MPGVTIYHNPRCSKSRQTLALIEQQGIVPHVIRYLDTSPSAAELQAIINLLNISPRQLMRRKEAEYQLLQLDDDARTDADLIQAIVETPKLMERPVVLANGKAIIGRPPENVLKIL